MTDGLVLLARGSDGSASQWDGTPTPAGVLLRWLADPDLGWPENGYQLWRAPLTKPALIGLDERLRIGQAVQRGGALVMLRQGTLSRGETGGLTLSDDAVVELTFAPNVSLVEVVLDADRPARAAAACGGQLLSECPVADRSTRRWVARAIDRLAVTGPGTVREVTAQPVSDAEPWQEVARLCLPLFDPAYTCTRGAAGVGGDIARARLPAGVPFDRFAGGFDALTSQLRAELGDELAPFPAPSPGDGPAMGIDPRDALRLVSLDINLARILGLAFDDPVAANGRAYAYRVVGHWSSGERSDIVAVAAQELAPPAAGPAPEALADQPEGPAGPFRVRVRWALASDASGGLDETVSPFFQVLAADGASAWPAPLAGAAPITAAPLLVTRYALLARPAVPFVVDTPSAEGYRSYWVRPIDHFGCLGPASAPTVVSLVDAAAPPPPSLLSAEFVQASLPDAPGVRSPLSRRWRMLHPDEDAIAVAWAWTPQLSIACRDADAFAVYARAPAPDPGGWVGPLAATVPGALSLSAPARGGDDTLGMVSVLGGELVDASHARLRLDAEVHVAGGQLNGAVLSAGGESFVIVASGDGLDVSVVVEARAVPPAGAYTLAPGSSGLFLLRSELDLAPLDADGWQRRWAGLIVPADARQAAVLGQTREGLLCRSGSLPPADGELVHWYPAYVAVFAAEATLPWTDTQTTRRLDVAVATVRRAASRPVSSAPSSPATLAQVSTAAPPQPLLEGPPLVEPCSQVATPADVYGTSRVTLDWSVAGGCSYTVWRALDEAVWAADQSARRSGIPRAAATDPGVQDELAALDATLAAGDGAAAPAAYAALTAGAQRAVAGDPAVAGAYGLRTPRPLQAGDLPYVDDINGRAPNHWFYRVIPRSAAGVTGPASLPTPPICAPDVTPPAAPRVHLALSGVGAVTLRWQPSPESDTVRYRVLRCVEEADLPDPRRMQEVLAVAAVDPALAADDVAPTSVFPLVEITDAPPAPGAWHYRIVAEDREGNRSIASDPLTGSALPAPLAAPTWDPPAVTAAGVSLSWRHLEPRLACQLERRPLADTTAQWVSVTGWLPRGQYSYADAERIPHGGWTYRLRVLDALGRSASTLPIVTVAG